MNNFDNNILDVVNMTDFSEALNGVDADTDKALLNYITKTRNVIAGNPDMFKTQQDTEQMLQMYDYLLANWNTENRVQAIQILANKEKELFKAGYINYDISDLGISDMADNSGFFSVLAELYEDEINELNGFFSKLKDKIHSTGKKIHDFHKKVVKKHISVLKKVIPKLNKINPVTIAIRNALRGLFAINFLGIATSLNSKAAKSKGVLAKVQNMYKNMGGKNDKLMSAIKKGAKKKALFNKKMQRQVEAGHFKGIGGLGMLGDGGITIGSLLTAAGAFLLKIWDWIKKAGLKVKEVSKKLKPLIKPLIKPKADKQKEEQQEEQHNYSNISESGKTNDTIKYGADNNTNNNSGDKKAKWKPILIGTGVVSVLVGSYLWWNNQKGPSQLNGFALQ